MRWVIFFIFYCFFWLSQAAFYAALAVLPPYTPEDHTKSVWRSLAAMLMLLLAVIKWLSHIKQQEQH
jgi:hypothetical protein